MADYDRPNVDQRVRYFDGQFLTAQDFIDEQKYVLDRLRRHARFLNVSGIVEGLTVETSGNALTVTVKPGTALDSLGRQIVLDDAGASVPLEDYANQKDVELVIAYQEVADKPQSKTPEGTRFNEKPYVGPRKRAPRDGADAVVLAKLTVGPKDKGPVTVDGSVRVTSGLQLPDGRADAKTWPSLRGKDGAVALTGSLSVTGNLSVTGGTITLDGNKQLKFADGDLSKDLKVQLRSGHGLGLDGGTLFHAGEKYAWRDLKGNPWMSLSMGADPQLPSFPAGGLRMLRQAGCWVDGPLTILGGSNAIFFTAEWSPRRRPPKDPVAQISNDTGTYQSLVISGNMSRADNLRHVSVWDRLEVYGDVELMETADVKLPSVKLPGGLSVSTGVESLRILRGIVSANAQPVVVGCYSPGVSVDRLTWVITFSVPFPSVPSVSVTVISTTTSRPGSGATRPAPWVQVVAVDVNQFSVAVADGFGGEDKFSFIAIGPR